MLLSACISPDVRASDSYAPNGIAVSGNQLVTLKGTPVRLVGVNRSGTEYSCVRGWGVFDGPSDTASVRAMRAWHINVVRLGLNEDCWLGINGVRAQFGGENYQKALVDYAHELEQNGMYVILDLHWTAPGITPATTLQPMPDADHALEFWRSVATTFADDPNVVFDVFNEPFLIDWACWRDGCAYPGDSDSASSTVGMQSLVDTIRATGARQPIMLGGLAFANDVREWDTYKPDDPLNQLIASVHVYPVNRCSSADCWDAEIAPIAASVPVIVGEFGTDWMPPFDDSMAHDLMNWADGRQLSYLAWAWDAWSGPDLLVTNYRGDPTRWGFDFRANVLQNVIPRLASLLQANAAYTRGDLSTAIDLYDQVANTLSSDQESQPESTAITGLARFRATVALTSLGDDEQAHNELQALLESDASAPVARLAAQFWDQYGMTGELASACAQLRAQLGIADPTFVLLGQVGVTTQAATLCVPPGQQ